MSYHEIWDWDAETRKEIASSECRTLAATCEPRFDFDVEELLDRTRVAIIIKSQEGLEEKARQQGFIFSIVKITPRVKFVKRYTRRQYRDWTIRRAYGKLKMGATVEFISNKPIAGSPIAPAVLLVIKWIIEAIILIIVAWFIIEAIKSWLKSMTTTKSTVTEKGHYPDCTTYERTEETEKPAISGMLVLGLFLLLALGLAPRAVREVRRK